MFVCVNNKGNINIYESLDDSDIVYIWDSEDKTIQSVCIGDLRKYNIQVENLEYYVNGLTEYNSLEALDRDIEFDKCGHYILFNRFKVIVDDNEFELITGNLDERILINGELCGEFLESSGTFCRIDGVDVYGTIVVFYAWFYGFGVIKIIKFVIDMNTWEFGIYNCSEAYVRVKKRISQDLYMKLKILEV